MGKRGKYLLGEYGEDRIENMYETEKTLYNLAISCFKWTIPIDGFKPYILERYLYLGGCAAVFNDNKLGPLILPAYPTQYTSVFYTPTVFTAVGLSYQKRLVDGKDDFAIIYNDSTHLGSAGMCQKYAKIIESIDATDELNIKQLRIPWIFGADEQTTNSLKAAVTGILSGQVASFVTQDLATKLGEGFKFSNTGVTFLGDDMKKHRDEKFNEVLTKLGIDNIPIMKKERLITDEANSNNNLVELYRRDRMNARREQLDIASRILGDTISVEWIGGDADVVTQRSDVQMDD